MTTGELRAERVTGVTRVTAREGLPGTLPPSHPPAAGPPGTAGDTSVVRDWRTMTRHDFQPDAPAPVLFDLEPGQMSADDGHGTGDLLELLGR